HRDAALHRVQDPLAAALRADPDAPAAHLGQRAYDVFLHHAIGSGDRFEGHSKTATLELGGVVVQPAVVNGEHVVRVPDDIRPVAFHQELELIGGASDTTPPMGVAKDGVGAPVAAVG